MKFDHIALISKDIDESIEWYKRNFSANVLYKDETWGLVSVFDTKIAFVLSDAHPPHIGFAVDSFDETEGKIGYHRDGSKYVDKKDPSGNVIEILKYNTATDSKSTESS